MLESVPSDPPNININIVRMGGHAEHMDFTQPWKEDAVKLFKRRRSLHRSQRWGKKHRSRCWFLEDRGFGAALDGAALLFAEVPLRRWRSFDFPPVIHCARVHESIKVGQLETDDAVSWFEGL